MREFMEFPNISVLIPCLNEKNFIRDCIVSLLAGSYSKESCIEIIVIDGGSQDETVEIVKALQVDYQQIKLLHNPNKIVPSALNIGIKAASYDNIVWVGAHAIYHKDYLRNMMACFQSNKVASVGGVIVPKGKSRFGRAVALATSSKFGVGNAKYRYAISAQYVDTVFGGCWLKSSIEKIGGFNEEWVRNQDYELNTRLRKMVGPILLDPSIRCYYFCRESIQGLVKQYFQYGFWRFKTLLKHPSTLNKRILAPIGLLCSVLCSFFVMPFNSLLALVVPVVYVFLNIMISALTVIRTRQYWAFFLLIIIYPCIHFSWAIGFARSGIQYLYQKFGY